MVRTMFMSAALMLAGNVASAQITTYVAPPRPVASPQMVAAADSTRRDSTAQAAMANMKAWVDSAAGVSVPAHVGDSTAADPGRPVVTTTFADGAVAPATASVLPAVALLGALLFAAGVILLAKRHRA